MNELTHIWQQIETELTSLLERRARLQEQMDSLQAEGCINGHIVEEWRGSNGPYYRLTFYVDPVTGEKQKPVYLGADEAKIKLVRQQIYNQRACRGIQMIIAEIDGAIETIHKRSREIQSFLASQNTNLESSEQCPN